MYIHIGNIIMCNNIKKNKIVQVLFKVILKSTLFSFLKNKLKTMFVITTLLALCVCCNATPVPTTTSVLPTKIVYNIQIPQDNVKLFLFIAIVVVMGLVGTLLYLVMQTKRIRDVVRPQDEDDNLHSNLLPTTDYFSNDSVRQRSNLDKEQEYGGDSACIKLEPMNLDSQTGEA